MSKTTNKPTFKEKEQALKIIRELKKWTKGRNVNKDSLRNYLNNLRRETVSNAKNPLFNNPYIVRPRHAENWTLGYKGTQRLYKFPNRYGASVFRFGREDLKTGTFEHSSYTKSDSEWELAVVKWEGENFKLVYNTPITDDVVGHLSESEVEEYLEKIKDLSFPSKTHGAVTPKRYKNMTNSSTNWEEEKKEFLDKFAKWGNNPSIEDLWFWLKVKLTQVQEQARREEREELSKLLEETLKKHWVLTPKEEQP